MPQGIARGNQMTTRNKANALSLLRQGMSFLPEVIDSECGNCEDTPCDDSRPRFICKGHKWLKEVRNLLTRERGQKERG